jgi:hypothetical protein
MSAASFRRLLAAAAAAACLAATASAGAFAAVGTPAATGTATLYVIQGVDGAAMDLSVDGKVVAAGAASKTVAGPLSLKAGQHVMQAAGPAGPVQATLTLAAGSSTDAIVHRRVDPNQPPIITIFPNDLSAVSSGSGRVTVAHVAAVGPADIRVNGKVLFANVANGEQLTLVVPSDTYSVDIVPTAASSPVVFGPANLPVKAASLTRVFAIGVAATNSMDAVVQVLPVSTRGTGNDPSAVDAGDGGQAQALIRAHEQGSGATIGSLMAALAGLGVATAVVAAAVRRRSAAPGRCTSG